MSGHSKWHNIQKTKGAQDAKRAAAFTKIAKELIVAVKEGGSADPAYNSRLATVVTKAKAANMPNDNIKRCLEKAAGAGGDNYESITYEGYGPGGVNDCLAQTLGLGEIQVIAPSGVDELGRPWGLLRQGVVEAQPLSDFLPHVKEALHCDGLRYVNGGKPVHRVAVGGGACASELMDAVHAGCDTFVTADVKYNQFWDARDLGLNLIDAGHFATENPVVSLLAANIAAQFPDVSVKISETHRDCMKFF